jgi:hypothetical protein
VNPGGLIQPNRNSVESELPRNESQQKSPLEAAARARAGEFYRLQYPERENTAQENITRYPDVIRRETRRSAAGHHRLAFKPDYGQIVERQEDVLKPIGPQAAQDRRATSYGVSADRWPALFEASPDDYFDEVMAVWRELSHTRRLSREQAGDLWSE